MSRNPVSVGPGLESCAMRTSGLSDEGSSAGEKGSSTRAGNVPQADSKSNASNAAKA